MGTGLKGNVCLRVNGYGTPIDEGIDSINRFVFKGHWRLTVNGKVYDPIFHSIDEDNAEYILERDDYKAADGSRFLRDIRSPTDGDEFESTFVWVDNWDLFQKTVGEMNELYVDNQTEVDDILIGQKTTKDRFRTERRSYRRAKELVKNSVGDQATFRKVVELARGWGITKAQVEAVGKILDLAAK